MLLILTKTTVVLCHMLECYGEFSYFSMVFLVPFSVTKAFSSQYDLSSMSLRDSIADVFVICAGFHRHYLFDREFDRSVE